MADDPEPRTFERWGYRATESRATESGAPEFTVRDQGGRVIGWITVLGHRFQSRGFAQSIAGSEVLGTFESIKAAMALVIGHYDMLQLRDRVSKAVKRYEAEGATPLPARPGAVRRPSVDEPDGTRAPQPPGPKPAPRHPPGPGRPPAPD